MTGAVAGAATAADPGRPAAEGGSVLVSPVNPSIDLVTQYRGHDRHY